MVETRKPSVLGIQSLNKILVMKKLLFATFLLVWKNLKEIAGRNTAFVALVINAYMVQLHHDFFSVLHSSENDGNCSRSTKNVSKLVQDFLDELFEKKMDHDSSLAPE